MSFHQSYKCHVFVFSRENWIEIIEKNQKTKLSTKTVSNFKVWFEYLERKDDPGNARYRCRICHDHYDKLGFPKNHKPAIANEFGILFDTKKKNQEALSEHAKSKAHANVISKLQQNSARNQRKRFLQDEHSEETKDKNYLEITARVIRTVYVINKLSLPFSDHTALVTLQNLNGLDMGIHHFERTSCARITLDISSKMHETLIDSLIKNQMPISIIVDDTTDAGNIHYKIIYFQTVEVANPVIYFYKLVELKTGTGLGGFEALKLAWESEKRTDFQTYMKQNLIGFSSDGDVTNIGKYSGTIKYLKDWSSKPIFAVHCMSHRLELVIKHAFNKSTDQGTTIVSEYLDKTINKVYTFYNAQGYKRSSHLKQTCNERNQQFYSLSKIITIRWIASDFKAMKALNRMWGVVVVDLGEIAKDRSFLRKTRDKAANLRSKLLGKNFLLLFNFLYDVVNELSFLSLEMQKRTALIVDFYSFKTKFESIFSRMKTEDPRYLKSFLNEARCENIDSDPEPCETVSQYTRSKKITYKNVVLNDDKDQIPNVNEYRTMILENLLSEYKSYFPDGDLKNFAVFDPMNMPMPNDYASARLYGTTKIKELSKYFQIGDPEKTVDQWILLLESVVASPNYCQIKNGQTSVFAFWSQLIKWPEIEWGSDIRRLLFTVLAIPISSAEAERGFSSLKYIRDAHRSRLTPVNLDAIMRIKLNGPDELSYFAATKYAQNWIKNGHYPSEYQIGQKKRNMSIAIY